MRFSKNVLRGAMTAERMRERMFKYGHPRGCRFWTEREDQILRECYPDYDKARKRLRGRSRPAMRFRAGTLGIRRKVHIWTGAEICRLRKLYPTATREELCAAFPGMKYETIQTRAWARGMHRRAPGYKPTGHLLLDAVRARCAELRYTMADLDDIADTKGYFRQKHWRGTRGSFNLAKICKAVEALDGVISVTWRSLD